MDTVCIVQKNVNGINIKIEIILVKK
jgi:hypothetical protein